MSASDAVTVSADAAYADENAGKDKTILFTNLHTGGADGSFYQALAPEGVTGDIEKAPISKPVIDVSAGVAFGDTLTAVYTPSTNAHVR